MKNIVLLYSVLLLSNIQLIGQCHPSDSLRAMRFYHIADTTYKTVDTSLKYALLAKPLLEQCQLWEEYIYNLNGLTYLYKNKMDYTQYGRNTALALVDADQYLKPDSRNLLKAKLNRASFLSEIRGDYKKALDIWMKTLEESSKYSLPNVTMGIVHNNLGDLYKKLGDIEYARQHFYKALEIYKKEEAKRPLLVYTVTSHIADILLDQKKPIKAVHTLLEGKQILQPVSKENPQYSIGLNLSLAKAYIATKKADSSLYYLALAEISQHKTAIQQGRIHQLYGRYYKQLSYHEKALNSYKKALLILPKDNPKLRAKVFLEIAAIYNILGNLHQALDENNQGITLLTNKQEEEFLPQADAKIHSEHLLLNLVVQKAKLYKRTNTQETLEKSIKCYQYAFDLKHLYQRQLFNEASKIYRNNDHVLFHEDAVEVAWYLYDQTREEKYLDIAFDFSESSKASVLFEEIKIKEAESFSQLPDSLLDIRYGLLKKINFYKKRLRNAKKTQEEEEMRTKFLEFQEKLDQLERKIKKNYPVYNQLSENSDFAKTSIIQNGLAKDAAFITYYLAENALYSIYIDRSSKRMEKMELDKPLGISIHNFRKQKNANRLDTFQLLGNQLYEVLIKPLKIPPFIKKTTIIPDKELALLPFEMLPTKILENPSAKRLPYLIYDYTISYDYSATILEGRKRKKRDGLKKWLGIAPVFEESRKLEFSKEEIVESSKLFNGDVLLLKDATKDAFIGKVANYGYVHLATHAEASGMKEPVIYFWEDSLSLSQIYSLRLHAELLVLSACETGLGKQEKAEGLMSLVRGFSYAGSSSLVATLWSVGDKATADIIQDFYKNLRSGLPKDEALRMAKLTYLKHDNSHGKKLPQYWAAFTLTGDTSPINKGNSWWKIILGFLGVAGVYLLLKWGVPKSFLKHS